MYVDYNEVGKRIAQRRKELGLKQREVNELAELSDKYLSNIEKARSIPSIDVLMRICSVLKTTPDYILLGQVNFKADTDMDNLIKEEVKELTFKQKQFVYNFIKWYKENI